MRQALDADVDVLCVQGSDAGGHTGRIGTMALMQNILAYVAIHAPAVPVAVAGGGSLLHTPLRRERTGDHCGCLPVPPV
ncbi:MAG: hypothetical protein L0J31_04455 [Corynebacterium sp.]|nr:hypothetical protein [Corynebacterium sp.]